MQTSDAGGATNFEELREISRNAPSIRDNPIFEVKQAAPAEPDLNQQRLALAKEVYSCHTLLETNIQNIVLSATVAAISVYTCPRILDIVERPDIPNSMKVTALITFSFAALIGISAALYAALLVNNRVYLKREFNQLNDQLDEVSYKYLISTDYKVE